MSAENKPDADCGAFDPRPYFLSLKGKQYLPVPARVAWMRSEHPTWGIITEMIHVDWEKSFAVFRATIMGDNGNLLATATKQEDVRGFGDWLEKAETGSVGRALALCGYGTLQALDLDEGTERIVDTPQARQPAQRQSEQKLVAIAPHDASRIRALNAAKKAFAEEAVTRNLPVLNETGEVSSGLLRTVALGFLGASDGEVNFDFPTTWSVATDRLKAIRVDPFTDEPLLIDTPRPSAQASGL